MTTTFQQVKVGRSQIWVEVEQQATPRPAAKGPGSGKVTKTSAKGAADGALAAVSQADLASTLAAVVTPVHDALRGLAPQEVQVELSLGIRAELGVFIAKGEGNASLKVTARWKFEAAAAKG